MSICFFRNEIGDLVETVTIILVLSFHGCHIDTVNLGLLS